jgi:hypothetical protein
MNELAGWKFEENWAIRRFGKAAYAQDEDFEPEGCAKEAEK